MPKKQGFEDGLQQLEEAVKGLESGELSLEDSLKLFERGIAAAKDCRKILDQAQLQLEQLSPTSDGQFQLESFDV